MMIKAHEIDENGIIINTIVVESLDDFPNLIDANDGGQIGQCKSDGQWMWTQQYIDAKSEEQRALRNNFLASTDYWVTIANESSEPISPEKVSCRQALRDLPEQEGWPFTHIWPEMPE